MQVSAILHRLPHRRQHLGRQQQHLACAATQVLAGCHCHTGDNIIVASTAPGLRNYTGSCRLP